MVGKALRSLRCPVRSGSDLENPRESTKFEPGRTHNRSRSPSFVRLVNKIKLVREVDKIDP
jgi:hypothetical protein